MPEDWNEKAKRILKIQLAKRSMKYYDLARKLNAIGVEESQNTIATKLSRGTFSFVFFLQCMAALGINKIDLDLED
jgi:hypothetical protein